MRLKRSITNKNDDVLCDRRCVEILILRYCIKIFFAILIRITILLEITFVTYLMSTCRRALYHIAGKTEFVEKMTINRKCRDRNVKRVI